MAQQYGIGMSLPQQAQFAEQQGMETLGRVADAESRRGIANKQIETQNRQANAALGSTAGAAGGMMLGASYGAAGGPIGMMIGGILGGIAGGLFK